MTTEHFDVAVVGAGLVGAAIAHELARAGASTLVLEAGPEPAPGASRSNSGILHTGFDSPPGTLETELILEQGRLWRPLFDELGIPYRETGALLVASDEEQLERLPGIAENAERNGVEVRLLNEQQTRQLEPGAAAKGSLLVPGEAITDPFEVTRRLLCTGAVSRYGWRVQRVVEGPAGAEVDGERGRISAGFVINCAGLYGDEVSGDDSFNITARRGEFVVFAKGSASLVEHILLPVPSPYSKGVLVFPTIYGYLCAGPSAIDQDDKEDWRPRRDCLEEVRQRAGNLFPPLLELDRVNAWAGLRPVGQPRNYIIEWSRSTPSLLNVAAIRSTGLSACLGIARHVLAMLRERGLEVKPSVSRTEIPDLEPEPWWERLNSLRNVGTPC
ncbi:MAG TPA: FAD-dependent oxidoreductase [Trueperaceae bacterium]